jgi:hypothetical protein
MNSLKLFTAAVLLITVSLCVSAQEPTAAQIRDWHCEAPLFELGSPTQAYKSIYFAVKCKNIEKIKMVLSKNTTEFMEGAAMMQKKTLDQVIANGLTESTFATALPELCAERVKGVNGALEVKRTDGVWEDLPFVFEDGQWKLGVGDLFKGTYEKPGAAKCRVEPQIPVLTPAQVPKKAPVSKRSPSRSH